MAASSLRGKLIRVAYTNPSLRKEALSLLGMDKVGLHLPNVGEDNSWGRGYFPLPHKLHLLRNFIVGFKVVDHKVYPDEGIHLLTVRVRSGLSIMVADMMTLIRRYGLVRVQSNENGYLTFYFEDKATAEEAPEL